MHTKKKRKTLSFWHFCCWSCSLETSTHLLLLAPLFVILTDSCHIMANQQTTELAQTRHPQSHLGLICIRRLCKSRSLNRMCLLRRRPESVSGWEALEMVMEKNITRQDNTVSVTSPSAHTV